MRLYVAKNTKYTIAVLGSHSALEICFGAKKLGFRTLVVVEKGRDKTYAQYYKNIVDGVFYVSKFSDLLTESVQNKLNEKHCIFIPHRSFEVYLANYNAIEKSFKVPIFGNRFLLRAEERTQNPNQYDLLDRATISYPKRLSDPKAIGRLVLVKVAERERQFERAFFLCHSYEGFLAKTKRMLEEKIVTQELLKNAVIEEFIIGVPVNFNFFYSPIFKRLELIGTDTRRQTTLEGFVHLPHIIQKQLQEAGLFKVQFEEAGHIAVTVLESLLEQAYVIGERFVKATQEMFPPGVIGPFGLQTVITAGPPRKEIVVFDIAPRMPGSPGIAATPYSSYLYGRPVSMGERVAMEIKEAIKRDQLKKVLT